MSTPIDPSQGADSISGKGAPSSLGGTSSEGARHFQSYMQENQAAPGVAKGAATTPIDLARTGASPTVGPNVHTLMAQARQAQDSLGTVAEQIKTPDLKLKRSQSHLLKSKLQDANDHIRTASGHLGIDTPRQEVPAGLSGMGRFLAYINDGQAQMARVQNTLKELSAHPQALKPGDMLLVQIKMSQAQQEIEYSSTLLAKVIDSIKSILNIQL